MYNEQVSHLSQPPNWPGNMPMLLDALASHAPEGLALAFSAHDSIRELTVRELIDLARTVASALRERGVVKNDRVILVIPNSVEFVVSFLAVQMVGAIPVPVAQPFSASTFEHYGDMLVGFCVDSEAVICVTTRAYKCEISEAIESAGASTSVVDVEDLDSEPAIEVEAFARPGPDEIAFLQYTSGSTSRPKGVMITHRCLASQILAFRDAAAVGKNDVFVSWLPTFHDLGLIGGMLMPLYLGCPMVLMTSQRFLRQPELWLRLIDTYRGTITMSPNFGFAYCIKRNVAKHLDGVDLSCMRVAINGAEPVDVEVCTEFCRSLAHLGMQEGVIRPAYGLAEATLVVTMSPPRAPKCERLDPDALELRNQAVPTTEKHARTISSVGAVIPSQEVKIRGPRGWLGPRQVGQVFVRGPSVMTGYFRRPQATAEALADGWLDTGDIGYVADNELYLTGRRKDVIIHRGRNYWPNDIEMVVKATPGLSIARHVVCFGEPGPDGEDNIAVAIASPVLARNRERADLLRPIIERRIIDAFQLRPSRIIFASSIPRTTSGKLQRAKCVRSFPSETAASSAVHP